jgi:hypothetical protein
MVVVVVVVVVVGWLVGWWASDKTRLTRGSKSSVGGISHAIASDFPHCCERNHRPRLKEPMPDRLARPAASSTHLDASSRPE